VKNQQILEQRSVGSALSQHGAMTRLSQLKRLLLWYWSRRRVICTPTESLITINGLK